MAFEIETFEVENHEVQQYVNWMGAFGWYLKSSQRIYNRTKTPTSAIAFDNVVLVNSSTEVEDFTELVFERNKSMPHYDKIVALEQEAIDLLPYYSNKRPLEPQEKMSLKEWVTKTTPSVQPMWMNILRIVAGFAIFSLIGSIVLTILGAELLGPMMIVTAMVVSLICNSIRNKKIRKAVLTDCDNKNYSHIMNQYADYCAAVDHQRKKYEMFDEATERIPEIIKQATYIIENN